VRPLVVCVTATTLAGCSCFLPPEGNIEGCTDANGLACFDRAAASQPILATPASFKTASAATEIKSAIERRATVTTAAPAPKPKANEDHSGRVETLRRHEAEKAAPAAPKEPPAGRSDTAWIVGKTTSPVDYSTLTTAIIHATSSENDTLTIRCVGSRTELVLRTEVAWRAMHASEIQVGHRIDDRPLVRQQWAVSADGKSASYKGDVVGLLRSVPEGARLKISVLDGSGPGQEATFQLTGLESVRNRIGSDCKWPPAAPG
jgi:hypothetical protein